VLSDLEEGQEGVSGRVERGSNCLLVEEFDTGSWNNN